MLIENKLEQARQRAEQTIQSLQRQANEVLAKLEEEIDNILISHGKKRCPKCDATGATERLDAGYMRRFGLREWDGCKDCGGDGKEKRGCGYLEI